MHLYRLSLPVSGPYPALLDDLAASQRSADQLTAEAVRRWSAKYPDVTAEPHADVGSAAHDLAEASRTALLVVIGSRGHSGLAGLVLGSVGQALIRHANCPVAIAR